MTDASQLGCIAAERIKAIANELASLKPSGHTIFRKFEFSELTEKPSEANLCSDVLSIYSLHLTDHESCDEFLRCFEKAKTDRLKNLAYPRVNKNVTEASSYCLYVGTSRKTAKRLAEHLGFGYDRTYSLHLGKWATSLSGGVEIRIYPFELESSKFHLLTYLEDALAKNLEPILGRRGNL